jgi:hypothetical protein
MAAVTTGSLAAKTSRRGHVRDANQQVKAHVDLEKAGKAGNTHRPHRTLKQAAPLRPLPGGITDPAHFRVQRRDRAGGVIHEYRLVA